MKETAAYRKFKLKRKGRYVKDDTVISRPDNMTPERAAIKKFEKSVDI